jgi:Protein of unknown function (DUF4065)
MQFKRDKFTDLVHYICAKVTDPSLLGAIKLNKVLWFSDTIAFAEIGESITGVQYIKQKFGPVPKPILPVINGLVRDGILRVEEVFYYGHSKRQFVSVREPVTSSFTEKQLQIVDFVIAAITTRHTAASISDLTHDDIWKLAQIGEEIPHKAMFASKLGEITENDIAWAKSRLQAASQAAA